MDTNKSKVGNLSRTVVDPSKDTLRLGAWIAPLKCDGCGGRVDTFYRYNRHDDALCAGCGSEWVVK